MLGGAGSIQAMVTSIKNNSMLLRNKSYYKTYKDRYQGQLRKQHISYEKITPEQRLAIRKAVQTIERRKRRNLSILLGVLVLLIGLSLYFLLFVPR